MYKYITTFYATRSLDIPVSIILTLAKLPGTMVK